MQGGFYRQLQSMQARYIGLLAAGGLLSYTPLRLLSLLIVIFVLARLPIVRFAFIGRLVVAWLVVAIATSCLAALDWLIKVDLSSALLLNLYSGTLIIVVALWRSSLAPLLPSKKELFNPDDLLAVGLSLVFSVVLVVSLLPQPTAAKLAPAIMWGGDNSSHLKIIKAMDLNHGYAIGYNNEVNLSGVLATYPQGWHMNNAFLKWTIEPAIAIHTSPTRLLTFYYGVCLLWFGVFIFMLTRMALFIREALSKTKTGKGWSKVLIAALCAIPVTAAFSTLFGYGFQTQLAALTFLLLEVLCIMHAYEATDIKQRYRYLLFAGLALAGSSLVWLFLLPIGLTLLGAGFFHTITSTKKLPLSFILLAIVVAACIAFQPAVQIFVKVPAFQEGILNQRGLVDEMSIYLLAAMVVAATILWQAYSKNWRVRVLYVGGGVAFLFSLGIMIYQLREIHELRYYYFKSLYTILALLVPLVAAGAGLLFEHFAGKMTKTRLRATGVLLVLGCAMLAYSLAPVVLNKMLNSDLKGISPSQAQAVADIITNNPDDASHIISIGSCNRGDDIRASQLASALSYQPLRQDMLYSAFELSFLSKEYLFKSMREFILREQFPLIILVNDQVLGEELKANLGQAANMVRFIILDSTPETEPILQCPDRIRTLTPDDIKAEIK